MNERTQQQQFDNIKLGRIIKTKQSCLNNLDKLECLKCFNTYIETIQTVVSHQYYFHFWNFLKLKLTTIKKVKKLNRKMVNTGENRNVSKNDNLQNSFVLCNNYNEILKIHNIKTKIWKKSFKWQINRAFCTNTVKSKTFIKEVKLLNKKVSSILKNKEWPMENKILNRKIQNIYHEFRYRVALKAVKLFRDKKRKVSKIKPWIKQSKNFTTRWNKNKWNNLLKDAAWMRKQLLLKILAVEFTSKSKKCKKAGMDNICFQSIIRPMHKHKKAFIKLKDKINVLTKIKTRAKAKSNQAVQRKGAAKLSKLETLGRILKYRKDYIKKIKNHLRWIKKNPIKYLKSWSNKSHLNNKFLKFKLLIELKEQNLKKYKNVQIMRHLIQKKNGKLHFLNVANLYDRCVQTHLKLIMKPYIKPLTNNTSFRWNPTKSISVAVTHLYNLIRHQYNKTNTIKKNKDNKKICKDKIFPKKCQVNSDKKKKKKRSRLTQIYPQN